MSAKLQSLTSALIASQQCRVDQLDSWVDRCELHQVVKAEGHYVQLGFSQSSCTLMIEGFTGNADFLKASISAWLQDHDDIEERESDGLSEPEFDVDPLDASGSAWDITISITFNDPMLIKPDEDGQLHWQGQKWSLITDPVVDVAEDFDLAASVEWN